LLLQYTDGFVVGAWVGAGCVRTPPVGLGGFRVASVVDAWLVRGVCSTVGLDEQLATAAAIVIAAVTTRARLMIFTCAPNVLCE
jgi:hypothetical protein